ncbi:MAG: biotin transporter BioY [Oscillospiraceae bacterium]|nr:biotin transporter BioY [Oscillospiraceae bacterium]
MKAEKRVRRQSAAFLRPMLLSALFAAMTAVGAFLRIPVGYTSFTLQLFFTFTAGILLGPYWGAASQLVYVALGLLGAPIFTEGGGLLYLAKPTCGFLLGLIPAAFVIGLLTRKKKPGIGILCAACAAGLITLYLIGLPYMYLALGGAWSFGKTVVSGCVIFLPFDALKILATALLCTRLLPILRPASKG